MIGFKRCPLWLKKAYLRAVGYLCEDDHKPGTEDNPLEIHRIIPGYKGGTYRPGNVKVLHKNCHKRYDEDW